MLFDIFGCFVHSTPFALPHSNNIEAFLLYIASSQFIEFSFLTTTFDIFLGERCTQLLTDTKVVTAIHCFKHNIALRLKPINTEGVNFLLSACSVENLSFTTRSCSLKMRHSHIFKVTGLVLSRCESTGFWISFPTRIKTGAHRLTYRVWV